MLALTHVNKHVAITGADPLQQSIGWVLEGHAFVIRNKEQFCLQWLPMFFGQAKFSSFTRKLYRWGFRKVNMSPHHAVETAPSDAYYFGNENFQRDNKELLTQMKSVTAAKTRTEQAQENKKRSQSMSAPEAGAGLDYDMMAQQQQQGMSLSMLAPQQLQAASLGMPAEGPLNQAALLQAMGMVNLQYQLAAAQSGNPIPAPMDPSQLLVSLMGLALPGQVPQAPSMFPQIPLAAQPGAAPTAHVAQPQLPPQLPLPFPQQPQPAPPPVPQELPGPQLAIPPGLAPEPADQTRLRQAIQMLLNTSVPIGQPLGDQQQQPPPPPPSD